eukprot:4636517-Pyramimonas_sp.AAC.1
MLRLGRGVGLGLPSSFKFGSGAGRWLSALALLFTIHGTIWWTTDIVEHQGEVAVREGAPYHCKDICSAASAYAEVSYLSPTSQRYYTPE